MDLCAKCKTPLVVNDNGSRLRCCGKGYLSPNPPNKTDSWFPVRKVNKLYLYKGFVI